MANIRCFYNIFDDHLDSDDGTARVSLRGEGDGGRDDGQPAQDKKERKAWRKNEKSFEPWRRSLKNEWKHILIESWSPALAMAGSLDLRQLGSGAAWNRFVGDKTGHAQWMSFGIGIWFGPGETVVVSLMRNQTLMTRRLGLASTLPGCGNWLRDQVFISQVCVKGGLWCTFVGGPDALIDWIRRKKGLDHKTQDGRSFN